jgi:hypothetical protein
VLIDFSGASTFLDLSITPPSDGKFDAKYHDTLAIPRIDRELFLDEGNPVVTRGGRTRHRCGSGRKAERDKKVSYYRDVLPILQARCYGCHQSAKASSGFIMTSFAGLLRGGDTEVAAIVPGKPAESHLLELVTPTDGAAEMPREQPPDHAGFGRNRNVHLRCDKPSYGV